MGQDWKSNNQGGKGSTWTFSKYTMGRSDTVGTTLERTETMRTMAGGLIKLRGRHDDLPQKWWFASTAIPLLSATIGPLSNVLSVAALITPWRMILPDDGQLPDGTDDNGIGIEDPQWEITLNAISLACGFAGNFFLLLNFTGRVRYIISLPLSILFWLAGLGHLPPPEGPGQTYSQGFWHAVLAAILYFLGSFMLMVNMLGYFRGHYPQHFELDDDQRTLILQTMMFFLWLAGGAGIFTRIEGWNFADALYYCDVSVLTIGFGDIYPITDAGRGFLFVFELIGIIFLGLVISSISRFARNISADKIVKTHQQHVRESTVGRTVTNEKELRDRLGLPPRRTASDMGAAPGRPGSAAAGLGVSAARRESFNRYGTLEIVGRTVTFHERKTPIHRAGRGAGRGARPMNRDEKLRARTQATSTAEKRHQRRRKLVLLREERDRFDAMREIQEETKRFQQYYALGMSIFAFAFLWTIGALVFMLSEARILGLGYFDALYFCFVALLTIGYGDYSPRSNAGKPFFIVWSLIAVPTMTILIQEMSSTVVSGINRGTFTLAEWTVMPKKGVMKNFLDSHPDLRDWLARLQQRRAERRRIKRGFELQNPDEETPQAVDADLEREKATMERLDREDTEHDLAGQLASAIKGVAHDLRAHPPKHYSYEQWVFFTKLIRFSRSTRHEVALREAEEGLVEWDWIGENSPMLADITEAEWVLDRLCESLTRYTRRQAHVAHHGGIKGPAVAVTDLEDDGADALEPLDTQDTVEEVDEDEKKTSNGDPSSSKTPTRVVSFGNGKGKSPGESSDVARWAEQMRRLHLLPPEETKEPADALPKKDDVVDA